MPPNSAAPPADDVLLASRLPLSQRILLFSTAVFAFTLYSIDRHRSSAHITRIASDYALARRALLLGTAASCSGIAMLVGAIGSLMNMHSWRDFRIRIESHLGKTADEIND